MAVLVGAVLAVTVTYATVATQKPDAKKSNLEVSADVQQAGGDVSKVVLRYGSR
jgi:hypothetical protein